MVLVEGIGAVLEEDEPKHDVLVLGGVHMPTQGIGGAPTFSPLFTGEGLGTRVTISANGGVFQVAFGWIQYR